ncbi:MAG: DUF3833 family protein [Beijerinckiaceae bacterium]|nr:DUF3833 family protein [Beijerinckiaceae bacterium]
MTAGQNRRRLLYVGSPTGQEQGFDMHSIGFSRLRGGLAALTLLAVSGCATPPSLDPSTDTAFVPEKFFLGRTLAEGEFVNTLDGSRRGLRATIDGSWNGRELKLVENFVYSDGERDRKTWVLTKTGPTTYSGVREDVIGTADGRLDGRTFRLTYMATVKTKSSSVDVKFDDVLGFERDGSVLNRATVSKLGVKVGEVTLRIRKGGRR